MMSIANQTAPSEVLSAGSFPWPFETNQRHLGNGTVCIAKPALCHGEGGLSLSKSYLAGSHLRCASSQAIGSFWAWSRASL
jgi:hypothetical protein